MTPRTARTPARTTARTPARSTARATAPVGAGWADGGNAIVEFALWLPLVLLALCSCLQVMTAIYDDRVAQDAARVGLRAQLAGADPAQAARVALAGRGDEAVVTAENGSVRVTLPVRQFVPWLPEAVRSVSATAGQP